MDSLELVFPDEVLAALAAKAADPSVRRRLDVLAARGHAYDAPWLPVVAAHHPINRARRAAWEAYFDAAQVVGLFEGDHGRDLLARLRGHDEDTFHGALAECLVTWVLAGKLRLDVRPRPRGRRGPLELAIDAPGGEIAVEVKTVRVPPIPGGGAIDYRKEVQATLKRAYDQFSPEGRNLLVIVFDVWFPLHRHRERLVSPLVAQPVIRVPVRMGDSPWPEGASRETSLGFRFDGSLLRPRKANRAPYYTRIGAVLSVEEAASWKRIPPTVEHQLLLVRNPEATHHLESDLWGDTPRFEEVNGAFGWSDGAPVFP